MEEESSNNSQKYVATSSSGKKLLKLSASKTLKRKPETWTDGVTPAVLSPLTSYLVAKLPDTVTVQDTSLEVILLLRIINALNRHWNSLYYSVPPSRIVNQHEFIHTKVSTIRFRIMTFLAHLPKYLVY